MKAYITLLSSNDYLLGVIGLYRSLLSVGIKYPFYCAISQLVDVHIEKRLQQEGIKCVKLSKIVFSEDANLIDGYFDHWNYTFDKLLIWELIQFEKLVFLDSDMMVLRNIDSLFECRPFSAVSADCSFLGNEGWRGGLNSGLMVIEPNIEVAKQLCSLVPIVVKNKRKQGVAVGDQDVIKEYCSWWATNEELHIDEGYNLFADHLDYYVKNVGYSLKDDGRPVFVVHFVGKNKPWLKKNIRAWLWHYKKCMIDVTYRTIYKKYVNLLKSKICEDF